MAAALAAAVLVAPLTGSRAAVTEEGPSGLIRATATLAHVHALYVRAHPVTHGRPVEILEEWRLLQDAMGGTFRVRRLGKDRREATILGPLSYENGVRAGVRWQQNRNGITFTMSGFHDARDAVDERAWAQPDPRDVHLAGESVALSAYVVEVNPPGGRHEWLYIDKRTGTLTRLERIERGRRYVTTYDDFHSYDGVPEPSHVRMSDSFGNEREIVLQSRTIDTSPDVRDVEIPPSRRTLVEFPGGLSVVRLPARFVNGLVLVRALVDGRPYDFLLDSGAAGIVLDPSVVNALGLERLGSRVGATLGTFAESTTIVPTISVGLLRMRQVVSRVVPIPFRADDRTRIAGLLGFDFFADTVVHLDYERGIAEAAAPAGFRPPPDASAVGVALDDKQPDVRMRLGTQLARLIVDTGANRTVIERQYADRAELGTDHATGSARFRTMGGGGVAEPLHLRTFDLGGIAVGDPVVEVSGADVGGDDVDGVLGSDLLRSYEIWLDYHANALYLRRERRTASR